MVLFPPLPVGHPLGFAPEAALEDLSLPLLGLGGEVVQLLWPQGFWQHQVLRGDGGQGSRKYSVLERDVKQYWPLHSSILAWRTPLTEKPGRLQRVTKSWITGSQRVGHDKCNPACIDTRIFLLVTSLFQ